MSDQARAWGVFTITSRVKSGLEQRFAHGRGMQIHSPAYPRIHLDEALGLYALDVYRLAAIENRQVSGFAAAFDEMPHDRQRLEMPLPRSARK